MPCFQYGLLETGHRSCRCYRRTSTLRLQVPEQVADKSVPVALESLLHTLSDNLAAPKGCHKLDSGVICLHIILGIVTR